MSYYKPTRRVRAKELLARLENGPCMGEDERATKWEFMCWLNSWITPEVKRLVPELREKQR